MPMTLPGGHKMEPFQVIAKYLMNGLKGPLPEISSEMSEEVRLLLNAISIYSGQIEARETSLRERTAYEAKTQIIRQLGHDLRTPLSQIAKYAYLIEHDPSRPLAEGDLRMEGIKKGLNRMGDLIRQIKELNTTSDIPLELKSIKGEVIEIVRTFWKMNDRVSEKHFRLTIEENNSQIHSPISSIHLFQVLDNLLQNAVDALAETQAGMLTIRFDETDKDSTLTVIDNGRGISEENLKKIHEVDYTTKTAKGTGLGLAIVKKICADYGIQLRVTSQIGEGSSFELGFPKRSV
jgi:signal transduction histidine kinase